MNKVVGDYRIADHKLKQLIYDNKDYLEIYSRLLTKVDDFFEDNIDFDRLGDTVLIFDNELLTLIQSYESIDIPLDFFDNPSQFVKDFEAKCIEEHKQKDIDVELQDKENRRKQFLKLQEEFKDEM